MLLQPGPPPGPSRHPDQADQGLADARAGRVFPADQIAADLAARRDAGE